MLVRAVRTWLGGCPGIGRIVAGMTSQGFDLQFARHGAEGWRATSYPAGRTAHSQHIGGRVSLSAGAVGGGPARCIAEPKLEE